MLGRLRMSTEEALEHYRSLTSKTFSKSNRKRNGTFRATTLEVAMKHVVRAASEGYNGEEYMIKGSEATGLGKRYFLILFSCARQKLIWAAVLSAHYRGSIQGFRVSLGPTPIQLTLQRVRIVPFGKQ